MSDGDSFGGKCFLGAFGRAESNIFEPIVAWRKEVEAVGKPRVNRHCPNVVRPRLISHKDPHARAVFNCERQEMGERIEKMQL